MKPLLSLLLLIAAGSPIRAADVAAPETWFGFTRQGLTATFPELAPALDQQSYWALKRVLSKTDLTPQAAQQAGGQVAPAVEAYARRVLSESEKEDETASEPQRLQALSRSEAALQDIEAARKLLAPELAVQVHDRLTRVGDLYRQRSDAFVKEKLRRLMSNPNLAQWQGRTAMMSLEDGSMLAVKMGASSLEGPAMMKAWQMGLNAAAPLPNRNGVFLHLTDPVSADQRLRQGHAFVYVLSPASISDHRSYLNDRLPEGWSKGKKADEIRAMAMRSIDDMTRLRQNGYFHESLAAISHSGISWQWDYWRWVQPWLGKMRFGPSSIHHWKEGLRFPNMRRVGLDDWEHLDALRSVGARDAYARGPGQNLTEWTLVVMDAARVNRLGFKRTVAILQEGFRRFAPEIAWNAESERTLTSGIRSTLRRLRWTGLLSGWVLQPLITKTVRPYVDRLRAEGFLEGAEAKGHIGPMEPTFGSALTLNLLMALSFSMLGMAIIAVNWPHPVHPVLLNLSLGLAGFWVWAAGFGGWAAWLGGEKLIAAIKKRRAARV